MKKKTHLLDEMPISHLDLLRRLVAAVRDVRQRRAMNAAEPPELQDAWDRLTLTVLEAERVLMEKPKPLDKRRR